MDRLLRDAAGMRASTAGSPPSGRGAKCLARRLQSLDLVLRGKKVEPFFFLSLGTHLILTGINRLPRMGARIG